MLIKRRIEALFAVSVVLFVGIAFAIQRFTVYESFLELEESEAVQDMSRCIEAVKREGDHLTHLMMDWAVWDDTYQFVADGNEAYISSNLGEEAFIGAKLDLIFILNVDGSVVWGRAYDHETGEDMSLVLFLPDRWPKDHALLMHAEEEQSKSGIVLTEHGPMVVAAGRILTSEFEGPPRGTIIMGRLLDAEVIETLVMQTRVQFMVWPVRKGVVPEEERLILGELSGEEPRVIKDAKAGELRVYQTCADVEGETALLIRASIPRDISARGRVAMLVSLLSIVVLGMVLILVLRAFLTRTVTRPLTELGQHVTGIADSEDLSSRIPIDQPGEIGMLAGQFNEMLERLEQDSRERGRLADELKQLSRQDSLTGLHNRRHFDEIFLREWHRALRAQEPLSAVMVDVDHFKQFNDSYGHPRGDFVLREVAGALSVASRRYTDIIARYGGEEFVIILPATDRAGAQQVAEDMRSCVEGLGIPHEKSSVSDHVTISVGVASAIPKRAEEPNAILNRADQALYQAKNAGRNRVHCG